MTGQHFLEQNRTRFGRGSKGASQNCCMASFFRCASISVTGVKSNAHVSKSSCICAKGQILKVATRATNPGVCGPENAKKKSAQELLGTEASGSFCEGFFSSSKSVRQHPGTPTHRKTLKQSSNGFSVTVSQEARSSATVTENPFVFSGPLTPVTVRLSKVCGAAPRPMRRMGHDAQVSWAC
jgi:hypothetical protein